MILYFRTVWVNSTFEFKHVIIVGKFITVVCFFRIYGLIDNPCILEFMINCC